MGGGGGSQNVTQEFKPPSYTTNENSPASWQNYVNTAGIIAGTPYKQSGIAQVAPVNDYQNTANQLTYDKALYGTPQSNAANGAFMNAAQGNYANPYAQNVMGVASGQAYNPWAQGAYQAAGTDNPYFGNAYTQQMIGNTANQMTKAYQEGSAAQNDAAANMAGAFGGGGWQAMSDRGQANLANQIGTMSTQVQQQQQNTDLNAFNQQYQNKLGAIGMGSGMYQGDVDRQLAANQQAGNMWQGDIGNILSGGALGLQGANAYGQDINALGQAGNNQNTYMQKLLDSYNNQWNTQNQYDANMNEYLGSALGRASGSYGNTATTQPGQSLASQIGGLGLTGAGIYSMLYK